MKITDPEVRKMHDYLRALGFTHRGQSGGSHHLYDHPEHGTVVLANSPSDSRWFQNKRTEVARRLGCTAWELDRLAAGESTVKRRRRKRKAPKATTPDWKVVMAYADRIGVDCDENHARALVRRCGVRGAKAELRPTPPAPSLDELIEATVAKAAEARRQGDLDAARLAEAEKRRLFEQKRVEQAA